MQYDYNIFKNTFLTFVDSLEFISTFVVRITPVIIQNEPHRSVWQAHLSFSMRNHKQFLSLFALVCNKQSTVHRLTQTAVILHNRDRNMPNTATAYKKMNNIFNILITEKEH